MPVKLCTRRRCWNESCDKAGSLRKPNLLRRKWNYDRKHKRQLYHIVPLKKHNVGKRVMASNPKLLLWRQSVAAARARLGIKGFALIKKGSALYRLAKSLYRRGSVNPPRQSSRGNKGRLPRALRDDYEVNWPVKSSRSRPSLIVDILPRRAGR